MELDPGLYPILFIVLIGLSAASLAVSFLNSGNTNNNVGYAAYGVNRNISKLNSSFSSRVNSTLIPLTNSLSSSVASIGPTVEGATKGLASATSANITSAASGINSNISSGFSGISTQISGITTPQQLNGNVSSIGKNVTTLINLDSLILNKTYNSVGENSITIQPTSQGSSGGYITGYLFAGFHNHILLNVSEPATFAVYSFSTYSPAANPNQQLVFNQWCTTQLSNANSINIWWNYTQQTDEQFMYVVYNTSTSFTVGTNSIVTYNNTGPNMERC